MAGLHGELHVGLTELHASLEEVVLGGEQARGGNGKASVRRRSGVRLRRQREGRRQEGQDAVDGRQCGELVGPGRR
jgi:hypothetical protein